MNIDVYYKSVYGNDCCYPACDNARKFIRLWNAKTFQGWQLSIIKQLGFTVSVVAYDPTKETNF